jgi:hypothetical protein
MDLIDASYAFFVFINIMAPRNKVVDISYEDGA